MDTMIQIQNLCKCFNSQPVLQNIHMSIPKGQLVALLGENGAGKSTLLNILCTSILADSGYISIENLRLITANDTLPISYNPKHIPQILDIFQIRKKVGIVFQQGLLDSQLTVKENLWIRGSLYHIHHKQLEERIVFISNITGICDLLYRPYGILSGGQKRRCDIARALLPDPDILLLDEPTAGLDPQIQKELWSALKNIQQKANTTILMSTHDMQEAALSDYIYILKKGRIIEEGTPAVLQEKYSKHHILLEVHGNSLYDTYLSIINGGTEHV